MKINRKIEDVVADREVTLHRFMNKIVYGQTQKIGPYLVVILLYNTKMHLLNIQCLLLNQPKILQSKKQKLQNN